MTSVRWTHLLALVGALALGSGCTTLSTGRADARRAWPSTRAIAS